jgi:hypothetical protein
MKLAAILTTVTHPQKQEWLMPVIASIEKLNLNFNKKIVSVDKIQGYEFSIQLQEDIEKLGWEFSFVEFGNRPLTLIQELKKLMDYGYILYAEDDILVDWAPPQPLLEQLLLTRIDDKACGILTPSVGGSTFKCEGGDDGDLSAINENTIYEDANLLVFKREEQNASSWFFELGTIFVNPVIFYHCLAQSMAKYPGGQIEQGMTQIWFGEEYYNMFYRASYCRPCIKQLYRDYPQLVDPVCKFITILDPNNGDCRYGGTNSL